MKTEIKQKIIEIAKANPNKEICGFIYHTFDNVYILECKNILSEEDQVENFEIDNLDYLKCLKLGTPCGIYHSHSLPDNTYFTQTDIDLAEEMALPIYVYGIKDGKFLNYIPKTYILPLEGLVYLWGFQDCYEIVRIYFRQKHGIYLKDYDRDGSYLYDNDDIITKSFESDNQGFTKIENPESLKRDDILVFSSNLARPQHFQIFLGNSKGLHHPLNCLSKVDTITNFKKLKYILRMKDNYAKE